MRGVDSSAPERLRALRRLRAPSDAFAAAFARAGTALKSLTLEDAMVSHENDDDDAARQVFLYVNKAYGYGDERPDHYFPALNYRMTELQGAVACGQLPKLDEVIARRRMAAKALQSRLNELPGITCPDDPADGLHSYWKWSFLVDERVVRGGAVKLGALMRAEAFIRDVPEESLPPAKVNEEEEAASAPAKKKAKTEDAEVDRTVYPKGLPWSVDEGSVSSCDASPPRPTARPSRSPSPSLSAYRW